VTGHLRERLIERPLGGHIAGFPLQFTRSAAMIAARAFRLAGSGAFIAADRISAMAEALVVDRPKEEAAFAPGDQRTPPDGQSAAGAEAAQPASAPASAEERSVATGPEVAQPASGPASGPESADELPIIGWNQLTIGSIRARLPRLNLEELLELRAYEQEHAGRALVLTMLDNRIAKVQQGPPG